MCHHGSSDYVVLPIKIRLDAVRGSDSRLIADNDVARDQIRVLMCDDSISNRSFEANERLLVFVFDNPAQLRDRHVKRETIFNLLQPSLEVIHEERFSVSAQDVGSLQSYGGNGESLLNQECFSNWVAVVDTRRTCVGTNSVDFSVDSNQHPGSCHNKNYSGSGAGGNTQKHSKCIKRRLWSESQKQHNGHVANDHDALQLSVVPVWRGEPQALVGLYRSLLVVGEESRFQF